MPGRFRAHPRPTSPAPSDLHAPGVRQLGLSALTLSSSDAPPTVAPSVENKRARALKRTLDALSPDRRRRRELEVERDGILGPWLARSSGETQRLEGRQTRADGERSPILARHEFTRANYSTPTAPPSAAALADDDEEDRGLLRPGRRKVETWMSSWWRRWFLLVGTPCVIVSNCSADQFRAAVGTHSATRRCGFGPPCPFRSPILTKRSLHGVRGLSFQLAQTN